MIAVSDRINTRIQNIQAWVDAHGWQVPIVLDNSSENIFGRYDEIRDSIFVIGRDGRVVFKKGYASSPNFPLILERVDEALSVVPVDASTWGGIKRQF